MTISYVVECANIAISLLSNSMLIYLSLHFTKHNLGTYKYLIMIFAAYDLYLTLIHLIVDPKAYNFDTVFSLFSARFPNVSWLLPIYCACFTVPFALTNINFLHRYWAVKKPARLTLFSDPLFVSLLSIYPIGEFVGWSIISFQTDLDDSHLVENHYCTQYNQTVTGWILLHHWKNGVFNFRTFMIIFIATFVMIVNFSIAIFLASNTIAEIRNAKTFSSNYSALHFKILRALFAQTSVPVLFVQIPFGIVIWFPILRIEDNYHIANLCFTFTSFFPAWDAIVVILLIKDYRDGLLSLLWPRQKVTVMETTAWKTQTTMMRVE